MSNRDSRSQRGDELSYRSMLMKRVVKWIEEISTPQFREFKRKQLGYALANDFEREIGLVQTYDDFDFGEPVNSQHRLVTSFLYLSNAIETLSECEFYFRRYPFYKSPVSREDHARNMCDFYFSQFYTIENRLKSVLNNLKEMGLSDGLDIGKIVRKFKKEFERELRARNGVIHHEPYDDPDLERLFVTRMMSANLDLKSVDWDKEHLYNYRKFASNWTRRVKRRSSDARIFLDVIACILLDRAKFLPDQRI
jgi:hypothetical protein